MSRGLLYAEKDIRKQRNEKILLVKANKYIINKINPKANMQGTRQKLQS